MYRNRSDCLKTRRLTIYLTRLYHVDKFFLVIIYYLKSTKKIEYYFESPYNVRLKYYY